MPVEAGVDEHSDGSACCSLNLVIVRTALPYGPYINYLGEYLFGQRP